MKQTVAAVLLLGFPGAIGAAAVAAENWTNPTAWGDKSQGFYLEQTDDALLVRLDGQPIATYFYRHPRIRRPFFAHVKTPGGIQVTRNFPPEKGKDPDDHADMHPGLWMAFGKVSGEDFWRNKGRIVHQRLVGEPSAGETAAFTTLDHFQTEGGQVLCRQQTKFTFSRQAGGWLLTIDAEFTSGKEFFFGVQEEMGLGLRVATPITVNKGGTILSSSGGRNENGTWGRTADWWDYYGANGNRQVGLLLMSDPANGEVWSHSRDYGLLVANPFAVDRPENRDKRTVIAAGKSFRLQYGVLVHEGAAGEKFDRAAAYRRYLERNAAADRR